MRGVRCASVWDQTCCMHLVKCMHRACCSSILTVIPTPETTHIDNA